MELSNRHGIVLSLPRDANGPVRGNARRMLSCGGGIMARGVMSARSASLSQGAAGQQS